MPFLLLDDAADEATRRLQQFGSDQLASLQSGLQQGAQSAQASAQDVTQRLMQFGQTQLDSLQQQAQQQAQQQQQNLVDITGRLQQFGDDHLQSLTQPVQQTVQQGGLQTLQPLTQPSAPPDVSAGPQAMNQPQDQ